MLSRVVVHNQRTRVRSRPAESRAELPGPPSSRADAEVKRRSALVALGLATAVGGNLFGFTTSLLQLAPERARELRLDLLWPVAGLSRIRTPTYEFMLPSGWLADLTLARAEAARLEGGGRLRSARSAPSAAFGPPGGSGETNISVVATPVRDGQASFGKLGSSEEVARRFLASVVARSKGDKAAILLSAPDSIAGAPLIFEYTVSSAHGGWQRHLVSSLVAGDNVLYTVTAQAPENDWPALQAQLRASISSFHLIR